MTSKARMVFLHERPRIEAFLRRRTFLHLYSLGNLDDRLWPQTTWHAMEDAGGRIQAVALMYSGLSVPVLLALADEELPLLRDLITRLMPLLPVRFYAHLSGGLSSILANQYRILPYGLHYKMGLMNPDRLAELPEGDVVSLSPADAREVQAFYRQSYPQTAFEAAMLQWGPYVGLRRAGMLVSVAGVHVCSLQYRVAAVGNVATRPEHRGRGYAKMVVGSLCRHLRRDASHIGLNVKADNRAAIRCYGALGFAVVGQYEECMLERL